MLSITGGLSKKHWYQFRRLIKDGTLADIVEQVYLNDLVNFIEESKKNMNRAMLILRRKKIKLNESIDNYIFTTPFFSLGCPVNFGYKKDAFWESIKSLEKVSDGSLIIPFITCELFLRKDHFYKYVYMYIRFAIKENLPDLYSIFEEKVKIYLQKNRLLMGKNIHKGGEYRMSLNFLFRHFSMLVPRILFRIHNITYFFSKIYKGEKVFNSDSEIRSFFSTLNIFYELSGKRVSFYFKERGQKRYEDLSKITNFHYNSVLVNPPLGIEELEKTISHTPEQLAFLRNYIKFECSRIEPFSRPMLSENFQKTYDKFKGNIGRYLSSHNLKENKEKLLRSKFEKLELSCSSSLTISEKIVLVAAFLSSRCGDIRKWSGQNDGTEKFRIQYKEKNKKKDREKTNLKRIYYFADTIIVGMNKDLRPGSSIDRNWSEVIERLVSGGWLIPQNEGFNHCLSEEVFVVRIGTTLVSRFACELELKIVEL